MNRLEKLKLLIFCIVRFTKKGKAKEVPNKISRIAIVPTGKLGDVVCTTPVLTAVRKHFPEAKTIVLGPVGLHRSVLDNSGLVDEYAELADFKTADAALITGPTFEALSYLYLSGVPFISAPRVIGYSTTDTRPNKIVTSFVANYPYKIGNYAPRERVRALEPLGIIEDNTAKKLGYSDSAKDKIEKFFVENQIDSKAFAVGVTPTAGHKIKEWPEERFAEIIDHLIVKHKAKVILVGGPKDSQKIENTLNHIKNRDYVIRATEFNVDELKALISKLGLFISVDTGPIYIAEAFGVPTIDITGPIDENEQPPRGRWHKNVVPASRTRPELYVLNAKTYNRQEALRQVMSITVAQVKKEMDLLLADIKPTK